ncbi:MAG: non-canonical purine NTP pyrophosphatase, RdgB/HAM1 family [Elusimicrobia bacterium RIFOXYB2_FULL_49_7]|nr:MAG: non-canonical purine NTP pyrophosphatase, RdgB/HAM1 family [Elusimicrobia bacterium RIFOXYB2_FULL_49_7]
MGFPDTLVLATGNRHKIEEIRTLLGHSIRWLTQADFPDMPESVEDGTTFKANAIKKAEGVGRFTGLAALADDSGLCVDALGGAPGVHSARYSGGDSADNNRLLLQHLAHVPDGNRRGRFQCVVALYRPGLPVLTAEGAVEGHIIQQMRGNGGFGYDPLFVPEGYEATFAEIQASDKNRLSHRSRALFALKRKLETE